MKNILILFIISLFLPDIESNTYNLQLKDVLSTEVCSTGYFIIDAELNMPIKDPVTAECFFKVTFRTSDGQTAGFSSCFLLHFEGKTAAKVGCITDNFHQVLFQITPSKVKVPHKLYGHTINLLPFTLKTPFQVISGSETNYYSLTYEIKLNLSKADETSTLEFILTYSTSSTKYPIVLDDIKIECTVKEGKKIFCPVTAKNLIQEKNHIYQPYLIDSNNRKKKNYFVNPIEVTLNYIK